MLQWFGWTLFEVLVNDSSIHNPYDMIFYWPLQILLILKRFFKLLPNQSLPLQRRHQQQPDLSNRIQSPSH